MGAYNKQFVAPECTNFASLKINCRRSRRDKPQRERERGKRHETRDRRLVSEDCRLCRAQTETISENVAALHNLHFDSIGTFVLSWLFSRRVSADTFS